jgi:hypothetical protein
MVYQIPDTLILGLALLWTKIHGAKKSSSFD